MFKLLIFTIAIVFSTQAFSWGGRGHHSVCDAATFLVKDENLKKFMTARPQVMGHLCNVPDIYWRGLDAKQTSIGNPSHYIDLEILDMKLDKVPLDYSALTKSYQGTENKMKVGEKIKNFSSEFGSLWWRADQFFRLAIQFGSAIKDAVVPKGSAEQQDQNLVYNKSIYQFYVHLGIMGHFVGDASQPYHGTFDYDGYGTGHGGIHLYYEEAAVNAQDANLVSEIVKEAKRLQNLKKSRPVFLMAQGVLEKMKALSIISIRDIPAVNSIDPVIKPSKSEHRDGKDFKTPAERKAVEAVAAKYKTLIISEMARSSALLAQLWDEAYEKIGKPELSHYQNFRYPFEPEFVAPDYLGESSQN